MDTVREQSAPDAAEATNVVKMDRQRTEAPASPEAPAAKKAEEASPAKTVAPPAAPPRKRSRSRMILPVLLIAALGGGAWFGYDWWTNGRFMVGTDDAYVQADVATLGVKVSGYVASVPVRDGDSVKAGDVLVKLDDTDYRTALDAARAKRATQTATIDRIARQVAAQQAAVYSAVAGVQAARAGVDSANASVDAAQAEVVRADAAFTRAKSLANQNFGSKANLDQATADRDRAAAGINTAKASVANAQAAVTSAQASLAAAQANLAVVKAQKVEAEHTAEELDVAVTKAQNDLDATVVRAPTDGIVGNRAAQPGQYVSPGSRLMALVPLASVYVSANFKETQLGPLAPGQKVEISVDAIDGRTFEGVVGKFSPASGSTFSLLPPENATGNFTKITQRVPVRIDVPADVAASGKLLPGMSVVVDVDSRTTPKS